MEKKMDSGMQTKFLYLFERMNEPLGLGMKGPKDRMVYYNMPTAAMDSHPSSAMMNTMHPTEKVDVTMPSNMPMEKLRMISTLCPRNGLFAYFDPENNEALVEMRKILMGQPTVDDLFSMACACRDNKMVNPHLFVHALASTLATRPDCKGFRMPAFHEVMPDLFYTGHVMKQAEKMAKVMDKDKSMIVLNNNVTGDHKDPESRLWYFREDVGINSHHFHWHVVFPGNYNKGMEKRRSRRGELFFYMHHSMMARYDAERLSVGLSRAKMFNFDDLVLTEGYFAKLYSTNAGLNWGNRQANTKLTDVNRYNATGAKLDTRIEDLKKWRDRVLDVIDTGYYIKKDPITGNETRERLLETNEGIDVLGDIIENSGTDTPHAQFYGRAGLHNMGHRVIAFIHDPLGEYRENPGVMGDTSTAMRDPMFYRWHKYIDHMFIQYKNTLTPYPLKPSSAKDIWPLIWDNIVVERVDIIDKQRNQITGELSTHWAMRDVDLARGLDFYRNSIENMDPVFARVTFLDYSPFKYSIKVKNNNSSKLKATVRIFLAPVKDEHGTDFPLDEQRHLFYEMDKFSSQLNPGENTITRESVDSSVTVKNENLFRQLEKLDRDVKRPGATLESFDEVDAACGCGWPQHLLLSRGTPAGMQFDLFVIITDGSKDGIKEHKGCRDAMSFCGIIDDDFPDKRPMGYPFDRLQFNEPGSNNRVSSIAKYASHIPNSKHTKITIKHDSITPPKLQEKMTIKGMKMVNEDGNVVGQPTAPRQPVKPPPNRGGRTNLPPNTGGKVWGQVPNIWPRPREPPGQPVQQWGGPKPGSWSRGQSRQGRQDSGSWENVNGDEFEDDHNMQY